MTSMEVESKWEQKENDDIAVLLVLPGEAPRIAVVKNDLRVMQDMVGGWIETFFAFQDRGVCIVCNEEGKLIDLPLNRAVYDERGDVTDIISGTFLVCGVSEDGTFTGLNKTQQEEYMKLFRKPEQFIRTARGIMALPISPLG